MNDNILTGSPRVGVIGSTSSTQRLAVDLVGDARNKSLSGKLVLVAPVDEDGVREYGLGTVTEITTTNTYHENPSLRGVIAARGGIGNLTGLADIKTAEIEVQASFRDTGRGFRPTGGSLSFAPSTGESVYPATADAIRTLAEQATKDLFYLGTVYRQSDIPMPLSAHDFGGARGAEMCAFFGPSGSGKALDVDTPIPTPSGFVRMGDLRVGDQVYDQEGAPCTVLATYDQPPNRPCYRVLFSDGSSLIADAEHLWEVNTIASRMSRNARWARKRAHVKTGMSVEDMRRYAITVDPELRLNRFEAAEVFGMSDSTSGALAHAFQRVQTTLDKRASQNVSIRAHVATRTVTMVNREQMATVLADAPWAEPVGALAADRLRTQNVEYVPMDVLAEALGASPRNGKVARWVGKAGAHTRQEKHQVFVASRTQDTHALYRSANARELANALANYVEAGVHNQAHKAVLPEIVTTTQMINMMERGDTLSVEVARPIRGVEADLPIDPYVLGAWLGDGTSWNATFTTADQQMITNIEAAGHAVIRRARAQQYEYLIKDLHRALRCNDLLKGYGGSKHIPQAYLFASEAQRRALLAGLMDTDGTVNSAGSVTYTTTLPRLAQDVRTLAASLGYRVTITSRIPRLDGKPCARAYAVNFNPDQNVFHLDRKTQVWRERSTHRQARNNQRYITSVEPVESRPVRCITVDSPRHLYLAGCDFIPTHNTHLATSYTGSQMRHRDMAFLLVDPQGQFTTNSKVARDLPFDLRALAEAEGREVRQLSVARQVRLPQDEGLFTDLLASASFFAAGRLIGANNKAQDAREVVEAWLETVTNWSDKPADELLDMMLSHLIERVEADAVVVSKAPKERMVRNLMGALHSEDADGEARRTALMRVWAPFLNMFSPHGPNGESRSKMYDIVKELCESDTGSAGNRKARPFYILTLADQFSGDEQAEVSKALRHTKTQMVILDTLFTNLESVGRWLYQGDDTEPANLMVILDEAARFTSDSNRNPEQRAMAEKMARFFRELRKYAIGFTLILQEPSALHDSIWKQLQNGFRAFASGMVGNDLDKVREQVGTQGAMRLYQQLARPSKDNPVYPWMLCGSISPLSVTSAPLFMEAYTSADEWAKANERWIPRIFNVTDLWTGRSR